MPKVPTSGMEKKLPNLAHFLTVGFYEQGAYAEYPDAKNFHELIAQMIRGNMTLEETEKTIGEIDTLLDMKPGEQELEKTLKELGAAFVPGKSNWEGNKTAEEGLRVIRQQMVNHLEEASR